MNPTPTMARGARRTGILYRAHGWVSVNNPGRHGGRRSSEQDSVTGGKNQLTKRAPHVIGRERVLETRRGDVGPSSQERKGGPRPEIRPRRIVYPPPFFILLFSDFHFKFNSNTSLNS